MTNTTMAAVGNHVASRWGNLKTFAGILRRHIQQDGNFQQAAAMTYNTLFSLLPTLVLVLLVISIISSSSNDLGKKAQEWLLNQSGLNQLQVSVDANSAPLDLPKMISERIETVRGLVQSPGTGLIAFAMLLWGALSLMLVIERAFDRICRITQPRTWMRRLTLYWLVLTLGPLAVAVSLALSGAVQETALAWAGPAKWLLMPMGLVAGFAMSWLMVFVAYRIIPATPLPWKSAMVGAVVGAALWELGKYGFGLYIQHAVGAKRWYGNLALLPLFLLWIYWTWNFLLVGLQVAYIHANFSTFSRHAKLRLGQATLTDLRWVLPLGVLLHRQFVAGKGLRVDAAAGELGITPDLVSRLLAALREAGVAHAVEEREPAYTLARPPTQITAEDLLNAARSICHDILDEQAAEGNAHMAAGVREIEELERDWARSRTLNQLAMMPHVAAPI